MDAYVGELNMPVTPLLGPLPTTYSDRTMLLFSPEPEPEPPAAAGAAGSGRPAVLVTPLLSPQTYAGAGMTFSPAGFSLGSYHNSPARPSPASFRAAGAGAAGDGQRVKPPSKEWNKRVIKDNTAWATNHPQMMAATVQAYRMEPQEVQRPSASARAFTGAHIMCDRCQIAGTHDV